MAALEFAGERIANLLSLLARQERIETLLHQHWRENVVILGDQQIDALIADLPGSLFGKLLDGASFLCCRCIPIETGDRFDRLDHNRDFCSLLDPIEHRIGLLDGLGSEYSGPVTNLGSPKLRYGQSRKGNQRHRKPRSMFEHGN